MMANKIHVANTLSQSIYVLPAKSTDWAITDLVTDAALFAVGIGEIRAVLSGVVRLPATLNTVADLYAFVKGAGTLLLGTFAVGSRSGEAVLELVRHFKDNAIEVPANGYRNVVESSLLDYFSPSGIASLAGASTVTLTVMSADGMRSAQFATANDLSWIATDARMVRARYGTLWEQSPGDGQAAWVGSEGVVGAIRTGTGHFVTATDNGGINGGAHVGMRTDARTVGPWEKFKMLMLDNDAGQFCLQTSSGNYVTVVNNGGIGGASPIATDRTVQGAWETFTFERQPDETYAIRTSSGYYLTASNGGGWTEPGSIQTDRTKIGAWETLTFVGATPLARPRRKAAASPRV